jgi:hypothetical protein
MISRPLTCGGIREYPALADSTTMLEKREGGCHCGRVRFRAEVDLDRLSQCSCTICTMTRVGYRLLPK